MIKSVHLEVCSSTQKYLKENIDQWLKSGYQHALVSAQKQTQGVGRSGNTWDFFENSLAFTFTLTTHPTVTLTSLELGILVCDYFFLHHGIDLRVKWPNDILTPQGQKCGGILCHLLEQNTLTVGIGLNFVKAKNDQVRSDYKTPIGFIEGLKLPANFKAYYPLEIYKHVLNKRLISSDEIRKRWTDLCYHLNKDVLLKDGSMEFRGKFLKISDDGGAIIKSASGEEKKFIGGSLFI